MTPVANLSPEFWRDVETILDKKLTDLQSLAFTELIKRPEATDYDRVHVGEKDVSFTLFAWQQAPSSVVLVLQASVQGRLGSWNSFEKGFVALEDGTKRPATQKEIESVL